MPRYDAEWIATMLEPERRGSPPAEEILSSLGLVPGEVVADVGCGPGFFTLPAARLVAPTGRVYAIDVAPPMLEMVRTRAQRDGVDRIETILSDGLRIPLDDDVSDLTLGGLILHDLEDRLAFARELDRITRPTGRIAIIEWQVGAGNDHRKRIPPEEVTEVLVRVGRRVAEVRPLGTRQYLVVAR